MCIIKLRKAYKLLTFLNLFFKIIISKKKYNTKSQWRNLFKKKKQRKEKTRPALVVLVRQSPSNLPLIRP
jgi:hypothetical protein